MTAGLSRPVSSGFASGAITSAKLGNASALLMGFTFVASSDSSGFAPSSFHSAVGFSRVIFHFCASVVPASVMPVTFSSLKKSRFSQLSGLSVTSSNESETSDTFVLPGFTM